MKARITSIKELQATCNDLYDYFVERIAQVTEIENVNKKYYVDIYLHVEKTKYHDNCLTIRKWNNGNVSFWADGYNGLLIGIPSDRDAIEIVSGSNLGWKKYTNKNSQKTANLKKRAILEDLQKKLKALFKDWSVCTSTKYYYTISGATVDNMMQRCIKKKTDMLDVIKRTIADMNKEEQIKLS